MKHWSNFLTKKTLEIKRLGKIASTMSYEVQCKELELQNAKANLDRLELQICGKIASNYNNEIDYENAISQAQNKARIWNSTPVTELQNPNKK
ncbi:hypothetical protein [Flavobacterium columnare]|uniref:hypothetical protein n=2 Tax=Flavobacterium columnare TaxID=996 RepID=UPI000F4E8D2C|nr:hypothetical protein [Flavobacterium columnare]